MIGEPAGDAQHSPPPAYAPHPVRVLLRDDSLERSRLTVFLRLILAIPHFVWLVIWGIATLAATVANWVATLLLGRSPRSLHHFISSYLRYATHVGAYLSLAANGYPEFMGVAGSYAVDLEVDEPVAQRRLVTLLRLPLAIPGFIAWSALTGYGQGIGSRTTLNGHSTSFSYSTSGVLGVVAVLAWFACLARGRMPEGFRNLGVYSLSYGAQFGAYVACLTDRYPDATPAPAGLALSSPENPVYLTSTGSTTRSPWSVFFRLLLVLPHIVWLALWTIAALVAAVATWFATLLGGRAPLALHRFLSAYVRYTTHVSAYLYLMSARFPGFTGEPSGEGIDLHVGEPEQQGRLGVGFRLLLALPTLAVAGALHSLLFAVAFLSWFAALATGRVPTQFLRVGEFVLRYAGQTGSYAFLLTERYPYSGPWSGPRPTYEPGEVV